MKEYEINGLLAKAINIIHIQTAEIERLRAECERLSNFVTEERCWEIAKEMIPPMIKQAKSEAYKEFAERLKDMYKHNKTSITSLVTLFDNINNLVKELSEVSDNA